jgi:hydroxymethylglutaryl-CoA lyase
VSFVVKKNPMTQRLLTLVECPRDSWQGFSRQIPTEQKISYLKSLLDAGFTHIDFGSFVSPKAVPQMADTEEVWSAIRNYKTGVYWIAIIANERGLDRALQIGGIPAVGYPFSISDTFQKNNTGKTIAESWTLLETLQKRAAAAKLDLNVYLSMGFGNPYGEPWSVALVTETLARFREMGIRIVMLADTTGSATPPQIRECFTAARQKCPELQLGAHLHASPTQWRANLEAALDSGCVRLDSALGGIGGCPFAQDKLVGNIPTEGVLSVLRERGIEATVDEKKLPAVLQMAQKLFSEYY